MSTNEGSRPLVGLWHQTLECFSAYKRSWPLMSVYECSVGLISAQVLDSKMNKMSPHKKMCSDIYTGVGTPHITSHTTQNQGGTPHMCLDVQSGVGTPHRIQRHRGGGHHTKSK